MRPRTRAAAAVAVVALFGCGSDVTSDGVDRQGDGPAAAGSAADDETAPGEDVEDGRLAARLEFTAAGPQGFTGVVVTPDGELTGERNLFDPFTVQLDDAELAEIVELVERAELAAPRDDIPGRGTTGDTRLTFVYGDADFSADRAGSPEPLRELGDRLAQLVTENLPSVDGGG